MFFRAGKQDFLENLLDEGKEFPRKTVLAIRRFLRQKIWIRTRGAVK